MSVAATIRDIAIIIIAVQTIVIGVLIGTVLWVLLSRAIDKKPAFLAGILDHLMGDEAQLLLFAGWAQIPPAEIAAARRALVGGGEADMG